MSNFEDVLSTLVARESAEARGDPERLLALVGQLSGLLGMVCAVAGEGEQEHVERLVAVAVESIEESAGKNAAWAAAAGDIFPMRLS